MRAEAVRSTGMLTFPRVRAINASSTTTAGCISDFVFCMQEGSDAHEWWIQCPCARGWVDRAEEGPRRGLRNASLFFIRVNSQSTVLKNLF